MSDTHPLTARNESELSFRCPVELRANSGSSSTTGGSEITRLTNDERVEWIAQLEVELMRGVIAENIETDGTWDMKWDTP